MRYWLPILACSVLFLNCAVSEDAAKPPGLADLPVGITSFGATFHDGSVYVFGGQLGRAHQYSRDEVNKPLFRLRLESGAAWEELPTDEPALGPSLLSHSSGIIRIGGMQPRNAKGEDAVMISVPYVRRFDPKTGEWSELPDLQRGRSSQDAFIAGDKIYVAGGWQMRGSRSSLWTRTVDVLDLAAETPEWRSIPAPFYRRALAVIVHNDQLYCIGGLDKGGDVSNEVDILDLKTEKWRKGTNLPDDPMIGFGAAVGVDRKAGKLYLTGFSGNVYTYTDEEKWEKSGKLKHGRMFGRIVAPANMPLLILGGAEKGGRPKSLEFLSFPTK